MFSGKKKKSIQYVAVKSVEKSRRLKVNNESRILNSLEPNPNIIKFYNFFETRNHLWLIFEFCPGGDLYSLINTDKMVSLNHLALRTNSKALRNGDHEWSWVLVLE